jgi:hypothetical protein
MPGKARGYLYIKMLVITAEQGWAWRFEKPS